MVFVGSFPLGCPIYRKTIMKKFGFDPGYQHTVDSYRRYITKLGYLQYGKKRGQYILIKRPEPGLTLGEAKRKAYEKRIRSDYRK